MNEELEKIADKICDISSKYYRYLTKEQKEYFEQTITDIWNIIEAENEKEDEINGRYDRYEN